MFTSKFPWIKKMSEDEEFSQGFHGTPFEKEISKKTVGQLADLLQDANIKNDFSKRTVVEHELNLRLAYVQSRATLRAGWLGLIGALIGALLGVALGYFLGTLSTK